MFSSSLVHSSCISTYVRRRCFDSPGNRWQGGQKSRLFELRWRHGATQLLRPSFVATWVWRLCGRCKLSNCTANRDTMARVAGNCLFATRETLLGRGRLELRLPHLLLQGRSPFPAWDPSRGVMIDSFGHSSPKHGADNDVLFRVPCRRK
ncbi:uncharacterized protein BDV17DRAFT_97836 [Aspergillus undulatus]|uniref:uncharacterized protein n=1 Tax=Aspergillus undulatus TaxID=1810928 RepID=UPI003CCD4ACA